MNCCIDPAESALGSTMARGGSMKQLPGWVATGLACFAWLAGPVNAQSGTEKIVIAFPPGGPVDFVARVLAEGLAKELDQTVVVDNRPGANGAISAQAVAKSLPDGNTLWLSSAGAAVMNPSLYENLTYDLQ